MNNNTITVTTYVAFGVNTTGLYPKDSEIIEIGAVKIINGDIVEKFHYYCKPTQKLSKQLTTLTGMSKHKLANTFLLKL